MKRILVLTVAGFAALSVVSAALGDTPTNPFPGKSVGRVFVSAQTATTNGAVANFFAPGKTVAFRAYAVDRKTHKQLQKINVKYFYVKIPNQKNVKLRYRKKGATGRYVWRGTWKVPASYPSGIVAFKVLVRTKSGRTGSFTQIPVSTSQLTITADPQAPFGPGPNAKPAPGTKVDVPLYVDAVNGTRPAGTTPRPVGCTQTNVFKRGEQLVVRAWGFDMSTGRVLALENVADAHFSVPGVDSITLNWGAHGPTDARVWFWTNQWQIPVDYPLGDTTIRVTFKTVGGKVGTLPYPITIIP
jgi:hypothetical protein